MRIKSNNIVEMVQFSVVKFQGYLRFLMSIVEGRRFCLCTSKGHFPLTLDTFSCTNFSDRFSHFPIFTVTPCLFSFGM